MTATSTTAYGSFDHDAFVYDSDAAYVDTLSPLLATAVDAGAAAYAVVPRPNQRLLADALGSRRRDVRFIDAEDWYQRPAATITRYDEILNELDGHLRAFVVGEVQFGHTRAEWAAWTRYESAINATLAHHDARVVCPYDERVLPPEVVSWARQTHPHVVADTEREPSATYVEPTSLLTTLPPSVVVPAGTPDVEMLAQSDPAVARRAFRETALRAGFTPHRVDELMVALNEIVTNAVVHGGGRASMRIWWSPPRELVCLVEDDGAGADDPLLGYRKPAPVAERGYGLWLARQMFDTCEFGRSSLGGLAAVLCARR